MSVVPPPRVSLARPVGSFLPILAVPLLVTVVACTEPAGSPTATAIEEVAHPMPVIEGPSVVDDAPLAAADFRGSILVVNVWATWCDPCRSELPAFARVALDYADRRVRFLGVNYQDDRAAAKRWILHDYRLPYPSIFDPSGETAATLGFPYVPDTYFVDAGGTIRYRRYGEITESQLRSTIERMLEDVGGSAAD